MRLLFLVLICAISWGCRDAEESQRQSAKTTKPHAAVKLTVLVVDDAELAKGIELLAGEWSERSGGELAVIEMSSSVLAESEKLPADIVIYPSRYVGQLVMREWLRPVRGTVLDDPKLGWGDFLTLIRDQAVRYGGEVFALSLGDMPLVLAGQGELPEKPPKTWQEYGPHRTGKDLVVGPFPLVSEFLARGLAATPPVDRASLLFDPQTFYAKLASPPLVRALEEMSGMTDKESLQAEVVLPKANSQSRLFPLLLSSEEYGESLQQWEASEETIPPVVCGFAGRLVSVTTSSRNAASAFKLLPWLVSGTTGTQLSQRSPATLWFRASQVSQGAKWFTEVGEDNRVSWLTAEMSRGDAYLLPRIPGIDQYLAELEAALEKAISGEQSAELALTAVEERWNTLTKQLGQETQRIAYNRHLGLAE
jgi:hypothetical protein